MAMMSGDRSRGSYSGYSGGGSSLGTIGYQALLDKLLSEQKLMDHILEDKSEERISWVRVIVAGVVAGFVSDLLRYVVDGVLLAHRWANGMKVIGRGNLSVGHLIWLSLLGFLVGIAIIWIYAAIRPHFGAGVKTAVYAGLAVWFLSALIPNISIMWICGLFSVQLAVYTTLGGLVEIVVGAIAGAALYKEASD